MNPPIIYLFQRVFKLKINKAYCDALRDLAPFAQFKKREKHPWRSVTFKPATLLKLALLHGCFSCFLNCTNATKLHKASHIFYQKQ